MHKNTVKKAGQSEEKAAGTAVNFELKSGTVGEYAEMNSTDRFSTSIADEKDRFRCFNNSDELSI